MPPKREPLRQIFVDHRDNTQYTSFQKGILIGLHTGEQSFSKIERLTAVPSESIRYIVNHQDFLKDGDYPLRSGRPREYNSRIVRRIIREVKKHPKFTYKY